MHIYFYIKNGLFNDSRVKPMRRRLTRAKLPTSGKSWSLRQLYTQLWSHQPRCYVLFSLYFSEQLFAEAPNVMLEGHPAKGLGAHDVHVFVKAVVQGLAE